MPVLLDSTLVTAREALSRHGFADPAAAGRHLQGLALGPHAARVARVLPELLAQLGESADPDRGLVRFERFLRAHPEPLRLLAGFAERPRALEILAVSLGGSAFLAETLIRHPGWFEPLSDPEAIRHRRSRAEIELDLLQSLGAPAPAAAHDGELAALRLAKRRELLRIGARDLLRLATVEETLVALTELAEALVQQAYVRSEAFMRGTQGLPPLTGAPKRSGFTVLGFGKLGGGELNLSSDVDLVYLYASDRGRTSRRRHAALRADFAQQLARRLTAALGETTPEGIVYRVDLRLRPEGRSGPVAGSLASFERYYRTRGATWERLALLKVRPVAGDHELGALFLQRVRSFVFDRPFGHEAVRDVLRMKHAGDRRVAERGESQRDVKLGVGGIREVELVVQALQVKHGRRLGALHAKGTLEALHALRDARLLPAPEADCLRLAYLFLRDLENKLQLVDDAQVHALPRSHEELRFLARRLGYRDAPGATAQEALLRAHGGHTEAVHRIFEDMFERLSRDRPGG